ncbi:MAG: hypothetical protein WAO54_03245, partial [Eubacteriales bacterium]
CRTLSDTLPAHAKGILSGTEFCIDDCYGYYVPDTIRCQEGETLRKYLADCYGCKPDELEIYLYDGEHMVTDYKIMD